MNKKDLIETLVGLDPEFDDLAAEAVNRVFSEIHKALARGEDVKISGFGTFRRVETKARACRNPKTGEIIQLPAGHKVKFKASSRLLGA